MAKAKTKEKKPAPKKTGPAPKERKRNQTPKGTHGGVKVLLIDDVAHVGKQGQIVEVRPGFARNYLLPNSLAVYPTQHNIQLLEHYKIRVQQLREARISDLRTLAEQITRTKSVTIEANANDEGHLYGSVGPQEICRAMRGKNLLVEPDMIRLDEVFRECGVYPGVRIALGYEIEAQIEVTVVPPVTSGKR
jgi:large subunit ribosomal protein L9